MVQAADAKLSSDSNEVTAMPYYNQNWIFLKSDKQLAVSFLEKRFLKAATVVLASFSSGQPDR